MAYLIDRDELIEALKHQGVYSDLVKRVVKEAPNVDDAAKALIKELDADLFRMSQINDTLRLANSELLRENQELKERLRGYEYG